jgi:hypothetical protein
MWPFFLIIPGLFLWGLVILNLIGLFSGWWSVAKHYKLQQPDFAGTWIRLSSARVGTANYNNVLRIGVNAEGLCLRLMSLFRPGHPPLFIPWADVHISPQKVWIFNYLVVTFAKAPKVRFRFDGKIGDIIAKAANRAWEHPEAPPSATPPTPE